MSTQPQDFFRPWNSDAKEAKLAEDDAKPAKKLADEEFDSESDDSASSRSSSSSCNSLDGRARRSFGVIGHPTVTATAATAAVGQVIDLLAAQPSVYGSSPVQQPVFAAQTGWEPLNVRLEDVYFNGIAAEVDRINQQEFVARQIKKTRPKNFSCHFCPAAFSNNGQLKGHLRTHTGEKPFRCNAEGCTRAFTRNEELTRHKRIHTGLKPYVCDLCHKKFGRKDHLKKHFKTHNRYPNTAEYDFAYMASLLTGHYYGYYQPMANGAYNYSFD